MSSWRASLVRIANHDVETLRKRLAEILDRRAALEEKSARIAADAQAELAHFDRNPEMAWGRAGFLAGVKLRRAEIREAIESTLPEEAGARDALSQAFEALKKFEHVADTARLAEDQKRARIETAMFDEMGLRKRPS